jgi:glycosyltransferase involved in cell wall biosynthesis
VLTLLGDDTRRQAMSSAGRLKAQQYAWPRIAEQVLAVYQRVLQ